MNLYWLLIFGFIAPLEAFAKSRTIDSFAEAKRVLPEIPDRGIISRKNEKLFEAWDKMYPVSQWECERAQKIKIKQGPENQILSARCAKRSLAQSNFHLGTEPHGKIKTEK